MRSFEVLLISTYLVLFIYIIHRYICIYTYIHILMHTHTHKHRASGNKDSWIFSFKVMALSKLDVSCYMFHDNCNKMHLSTWDFIINIGRAKIFAIHEKVCSGKTFWSDILLSGHRSIIKPQKDFRNKTIAFQKLLEVTKGGI